MTSKEMLNSGMLELYLLGCLDSPDAIAVETALKDDETLQKEFEQIENTFFELAQANAIPPGPTVKPLLLAKIDYIERLNKGEIAAKLPLLNEESKIEDFAHWLCREDMQLDPGLDNIQVKIVSVEHEKMTAIVWLQNGAPPEIHDDELENFLIVQGTCNLVIGSETHTLQPTDYFSIPLHLSHHVQVTSDVPCKIILQRVKA